MLDCFTMLFIILSVSLLLITCFFLYSSGKYWERRGVPGPKPLPIVGNMLDSFLMRKSPGQIFTQIYNEFPNTPIVGVFRGSVPCLLVRDPNVIRDVTVKEFSHFRDNEIQIDKKVDLVFGRNPFVLKGDEWRIVRGQLVPCFSSAKMKLIYPLLDDTGNRFVDYIKALPNSEGWESKELCSRFTLNNVASCAFGLDAQCFEETKSDFFYIATGSLAPQSWSMFKLFVLQILPQLNRFVSVKFTPDHIEKKLIDLVKSTLQYRKENNIVRMDFLHLMSQLKQTCKEYVFTDLDVTAHAAGFIGDGFETSALTMSYILYELASNPDIQTQLRKEIEENLESGHISYDTIQAMPYLEAVMSESLRIHPAIFSLLKTCTKEYTYRPNDDSVIKKPVTIAKDTAIIIPLQGLQKDPEYFPEPDVFKPERFLASNKEKMTKYTYLPFGEGPRACLGQRFALLQLKVGIVKLIKNFEIRVSPKTKIPFQYDPVYIMAWPIGGIWLKFNTIESS